MITTRFNINAGIEYGEQQAVEPMEKIASHTVTNAVSSMAFSSGRVGQPPRIRTGRLASSLRWTRRGKKVRVGYGPEGWYARFLEPTRPTLLPALRVASRQVL